MLEISGSELCLCCDLSDNTLNLHLLITCRFSGIEDGLLNCFFTIEVILVSYISALAFKELPVLKIDFNNKEYTIWSAKWSHACLAYHCNLAELMMIIGIVSIFMKLIQKLHKCHLPLSVAIHMHCKLRRLNLFSFLARVYSP